MLRQERLPGGDLIENAYDQIKAIRRGSDENAISTFNAAHRSIQDAIKRSADLIAALTEPNIRDLARAKATLVKEAPALADEPDVDPALTARGKGSRGSAEQGDLLPGNRRDRTGGHRDPSRIQTPLRRRAGRAGCAPTSRRLKTWRQTPGLGALGRRPAAGGVAPPAPVRGSGHGTTRRSGTFAPRRRPAPPGSPRRSRRSIKILEGERLATVSVNQFFNGGIENEEQLDQALSGIRDEFSKLSAPAKK